MNKLEILVTEFHKYADLKKFIFAHGFAYDVNLKDNEGDNVMQDTFLHLYEVQPSPEAIEPFGLDWGVFRVNFFIGMNSLPKETFYKSNKGVSDLTGYKFDKYFVPSFDAMTNFIDTMSNCNDLDFTVNSITKKQNYQDINMDGFLISASVKLYNK